MCVCVCVCVYVCVCVETLYFTKQKRSCNRFLSQYQLLVSRVREAD